MYDELIKALHEGAEFLECSTPGIENSFARMCHNAADAIEELVCMVADEHNARLDAEERQRWIPVTERLPQPNAVDKYGFAKGYLVKTNRHVMMHTARYNGKWWILWGKAEVITDTVTHWMPLPEPPKER